MPNVTQGTVIEKTDLNSEITQLIIKPTSYIEYIAGQYLEILHPNYEHLFFSIANAPNKKNYHLHIRKNSTLIRDLLAQPFSLSLPLGQCTWQKINTEQPVLFIAGGTGFAPIHAILEQIYLQPTKVPMTLIWIVKSAEDLYYHQALTLLKNEHSSFQYYPYLGTQFTLKTFLNPQLLKQLLKSQIVLAGPFSMAYTLRDELIQLGVPLHAIHSDAFEFNRL